MKNSAQKNPISTTPSRPTEKNHVSQHKPTQQLDDDDEDYDYDLEQEASNSKITSQSAALFKESSVADSLYDQSFLLSSKKRQQNEKHLQAIKDEIKQQVHSPRRDKPEPTTPSSTTEGNKNQTLQSPRFKPAIDPVSNEIASRLVQKPMERLIGGHMESTKPKFKGSDDTSAYSFKPYINPKSKEIEEQKFGSTYFGSRISHWETQEKRKKDKLKQKKREIESQELADCTFSPRVSSPRQTHQSNRDFADRNSMWERKRQQKIKEVKNAVLRKEKEECSFKPVRARHSSPVSAKSNINADENNRELIGFEEFVARQKSARDRKPQEPVPGAGWKNTLTKPVAPVLGRKNSDKIKALDRPVAYPGSPNRYSSPQQGRSNSNSRSSSPVSTPRRTGVATPRSNVNGYSTPRSASSATGRITHPSPVPHKLAFYKPEEYDVAEDEDEDEVQDIENSLDPETFPRQGLFSSRSTVNILEELRHNLLKGSNFKPPAEEKRSLHISREDTTPPSDSDYRVDEEWAKRSKQKDG
jgi:hypothetical protein